MDDIVISIVSGTYNRLPHLKGMVASTRRSIGVGIPYEIVLVDGGSTDGTIDWCKSQHDIVLIEQGKLLGAVKAFNAGACKARGRYVILANDDVEFVDESVLHALAFMENNLDVGVGCFFQDRGNQRFHVEMMPVIFNDKQEWHYYGQVCIVPRWLGDKVGWWGDLYHTYGGDNELSCNVLEAGYKVEPVRCACIHDVRLVDDLRRHNLSVYSTPAEAAKSGNPHKDTVRWADKWRKSKTLIGPVVGTRLKWESPLKRRLRVFYAPIYEPGHEIQKRSKRGLRNALARIGIVCEYDYAGVASRNGRKYCKDFTHDLAHAFKPDVFIFQIQGWGEYDSLDIKSLRREHRNAKFVNWNGDYHPDVLYNSRYVEMLREFDLNGLVATSVDKHYDDSVKWFYWQIGYEESDAKPDANTQRHDVVFLANGYSGARLNLGRMLKSLRGIDVGIYGSWTGVSTDGNTLYDFDAGQQLYRAAKLSISDSQWPRAAGFVSNRLFQALAAGGAMLLQQKFDGMEELLGLRSGVHLDTWETMGELHEKIKYWLDSKNTRKRKRIAKAGCNYVLEHHSFDVRVRELLDKLNSI